MIGVINLLAANFVCCGSSSQMDCPLICSCTKMVVVAVIASFLCFFVIIKACEAAI